MTVAERIAGSFRDPAGFVFSRDGVLYRQVNRRAAADYDALMSSGLYDALTGVGLLVAHDEVDVEAAAEDAHRILCPQRVPFVSQPSEWCPGQLRDAALATLRIQALAMDHGMTLRDASAMNVQFVRGLPVLIDTLSLGRLVADEPWVAYRQFCQHFLAPLALAVHVDARLLGLLAVHLDGIPLDLCAALLPSRTKLSPGLGMHLHAHARFQRTHATTDAAARKPAKVAAQALAGIVRSLEAAVTKLVWEPPASAWRDYDAACPSYSDQTMTAKNQVVAEMLAALSPATVWDLGANTARFSLLAAESGASVVALEGDPSAVELAWREVKQREAEVLPLVTDLSNPTPAGGWAHTERPSLSDRGPADLVLALAVVHHLAIGNNVPFDALFAWFARIGRSVVVEWVGKDDPMVAVLLASREDVFDHYDEASFTAAAAAHFEVVRREPLPGSTRVLYQLSAHHVA